MNSSAPIFKTFAPQYWDKELSALPLFPETKKPSIAAWQSFYNIPGQTKRESWLKEFSGGNIGLLLGTPIGNGYRLGAIDVDDERFVHLVEQLVGSPVIAKRGAKGVTVFVKYKEDAKLKSTSFRSHDHKQVMDNLS